MHRFAVAAAALLVAGSVATPAAAASERVSTLRGSPASMQEQNRIARDHGLAFYRTPAEIRRAVERGELVEFRGNADYAVADFVGHPYAQPELLVFVERLASQYRAACGQKLVVTSLVRPASQQPANAHQLSVHPAGMAVDLRISDRPACVQWLSDALLGLDGHGVLNATREFRPPHFHVAVYPQQYMEYAAERLAAEAAAAAEAEAAAEPAGLATAAELDAGVALVASSFGSGSGPASGAGGGSLGWFVLLGLLPLPIVWLAARRRRVEMEARQPVRAAE
jgi:hypothetical protein